MATRKATTRKKATRKAPAPPPPTDLREPRAPTPAAFEATLEDLRAVLETLPPPAEPHPLDLVEAMIHFVFAEGVPCALGQEANRRLATGFVDRNEFRLTEAFEIEQMLQDLEIPDLFRRCQTVRDAVAQIYNDQNAVELALLRDAKVTDRNQFFARVPAISPSVVKFLVDLVSFEEILFSDRSTLRVHQRMGLDPKSTAVNEFVGAVKPLLVPFGHVPVEVPPATEGGAGQPPLCPACILTRLAPSGRKRGE